MKLQFNSVYTPHLAFGSMKKSAFSGLELCFVNKFQAPIEKWNSKSDLDNFAQEKLDALTSNKKLDSPRFCKNCVWEDKTRIVSEWINNLVNGEKKLGPAESFFILNSIFQNLAYDIDTVPVEFDKETLYKTIDEIEKTVSKDRRAEFNFDKMYRTNLRQKYIQEEMKLQNIPSENLHPFWIKISSENINSKDEFNETVKKFKAISSPLWCTTNDNKARSIIENDKFYIYLDEKETKLGIRQTHDRIFDVQGKLNNFIIPLDVVEPLKEKIDELDKKTSAESKFDFYYKNALLAKKILNDIPNAIYEKDYEKIWEYLEMEPEKLPDGNYSIKNYIGYPLALKYFSKYGINEKDFFEKIVKIEGDAHFGLGQTTSTHNIKEIAGDANFIGTKIESLGKIEKVGKKLNLNNSNIKDLGNLKEVGGELNASDCPLKDFGNLEKVGGWLVCANKLLKPALLIKEVSNRQFLEQRYNELN